jgi:hypothetical protein
MSSYGYPVVSPQFNHRKTSENNRKTGGKQLGNHWKTTETTKKESHRKTA